MNNCFNGCGKLQLVELPSSIKSIGGGAFFGCRSDMTIKFPDDSDYQYDKQSLIVNKALTEIVQFLGTSYKIIINSSITKIKSRAFQGHSELYEVAFDGTPSLTAIEDNAFNGCSNLTIFQFPETLQSVGQSAFTLSNISSIYLGKSFKTIAKSCFSSCSKLEEIISDSEETIVLEERAFYSCRALRTLTFNAKYPSSIGKECFYGCSSLSEYTFNSDLSSINEKAFSYTSLEKANMDSTEIGELPDYCFYHCTCLNEFSLPCCVRVIGSFCFAETMIENIILTPSLVTLKSNSFKDCVCFTTLVIPSLSCFVYNYSAFKGCSSFAAINNSCSRFSLQNSALYNSEMTELILLPKSSPTRYLSIPENVKEIKQSALSECKNLNVVFIPDNSVTSISDYAFEMCVNLRVINFPKSIASVGENAFKGCKNLQCGLFIDNTSPEFLKSLVKAKLPPRSMKNCIPLCTCKSSRNGSRLNYIIIILISK